jgi:hypothetical protein
MVRIAFSACRCLRRVADDQEILYRVIDTGKKLPFVNAEKPFARLNLAKEFPGFDNQNF